MKKNELTIKLLENIDKTIRVLDEIQLFYENFINNDFTKIGKSQVSATVFANIFENFYTCLETLFLRISQFFENSLDKKHWHSDLLDKMTVEVSAIRIPVISDKVHQILMEILRFRHFKRYYFEFHFDWDRIEFLEKKYNQVRPLVMEDINKFKEFLNQLIQTD